MSESLVTSPEQSIHVRLLPVSRNVVWLADTNYRINLDNDTVRSLAAKGDLDGLIAADQVGPVFPRDVLPLSALLVAEASDGCRDCIRRV
jgi:hypothetical protein